MEFHFFGTGSGVPSIERNVSACAVRFLQQRGKQWLFDCGEATQHQILRSSIALGKIERIFITHLHGDHIFGLPGLLGSRSFQGGENPLFLYGPKGIRSFVETALQVSNTHVKYELTIEEFSEPGLLFHEEGFKVETVLLDHVMPCYAFKVTEDDRPGELLVDRLKAKGVPPGPLYRKIQQGETVELPTGERLEANAFLGPPKRGRSFVLAGDTRPVKELIPFAKNVNVLIHEATFLDDKKGHAHEYGHSTMADAIELAKQANVDHLILTHISSRYHDMSDELQKKAQNAFANAVVAHDFYVFHLPLAKG
ncbi:ribonuclease Z [Halalkalibacterium halodurans]|uniref:ribonuclease Z n=1 Tax=Halalkalibacterium halodurans TaxID=86665 RepID=UPI002E24E0A8|nr:ribonuclease Z [Halalkalibacterium halodurans]MED4123914.1 ribonuclease Z [Halalkalibacterium halodurans]